VRYWPNPAHKRETTESGPPRWRPDKTPCPNMTVAERQALLRASIPEDVGSPGSRRYALRRGDRIEWFVAVVTEFVGGQPVFHDYPVTHVPSRVLRVFRDQGLIIDSEYQRMIKAPR
jgi:hypothetical protein